MNGPPLDQHGTKVRAKSGKSVDGRTTNATNVPRQGHAGRQFSHAVGWETDDDQYVIQGFTLDAEALGQVGTVPDGELVIRVPKKLMRHLKDVHGATEL
jgi:hypothetical protein